MIAAFTLFLFAAASLALQIFQSDAIQRAQHEESGYDAHGRRRERMIPDQACRLRCRPAQQSAPLLLRDVVAARS